jgi:RNA polymerase sigma-70 factor (ECF subfamily)
MWTAIEEARVQPAARQRLDAIIRSYWKPVYVCIRAGWGKAAEDAKDLTQAFFTWMLDGDVLAKVERGRGRFRGFMRATVRNFLSNRHRYERQLKRGGPRVALDISDPAIGAAVPPAAGLTPEDLFDREWARTLLENAVAEFERSADARAVEVFRLFQSGIDEPVYESIAARTGLTRDVVKHLLQKSRERLREIIVGRIKEYALDDVETQQELELLRNAWA